MVYLTKLFWLDAIERAIKTVAQTMLALWAVAEVAFNVLNVDWELALGVGLGAGLISLLMSIASAQTNNTNSASLVVDTVRKG